MKSNFYYILIWGHGIKFSDSILEIARSKKFLKIKKIIYHKPKSINKLIDVIYSYDYAPIDHLKSKVKYLKSTPNEVIIIFVENKNPNVDLLGEGAFRHEESLYLKELKETIRNKYNPRDHNGRTENHVIHASDNELQTDYILKYLGFAEGIDVFNNKNQFISCPYYMNQVRKIIIKKISIHSLICNIATGLSRYNFKIKLVNLRESPHYKGLTENISIYKEYIDNYLGGPLTEDYFPEKFIKLSREFQYLEGDNSYNYILVKKNKEKYLILDGLHRASILASRGENSLVVGEVVR